jgi:hypothetical protein
MKLTEYILTNGWVISLLGFILLLIDWASYNFTYDYSVVTPLGWVIYIVGALMVLFGIIVMALVK